MSPTWTIAAVKVNPENVGTHDLLVSFLTCSRAWRRLSKPARSALQAAYTENILVYAHPNTLRSLWKHGFITYDEQAWGVLTDAGREVCRWMVKP